ncbi:LAMI_0B07998g1_1 [Lachancea mirantina]|uniref:Kinesin-like protein n=1 Tax=Lachancea mirantina TaxID=1230905 RepID=A0A1G4IXY9_9SACH|nr:LAMI_0B07998g1_1 [Lachancea mirantina]
MSEAEELNITVAIRCRGRNKLEIRAKSPVVVTVPDVTGSGQVSINTSGDVGIAAQMSYKTYMVDKVFGPSADQALLFTSVAEPLFRDFIRGYNCTVLVYGMTSTGKTYTMTGDEKLYDDELSEAAGMIPRVLFKLFETLDVEDDDYMVKCSFVELYNEELRDLLDSAHDTALSKRLRIYDSASSVNSGSTSSSRTNSPRPADMGNEARRRRARTHSGGTSSKFATSAPSKNTSKSDFSSSAIYIQNLQEFHIVNARDGIRLLQRGLRQRQVATTKMNDFSSRSHTIFTIMLYKKCDGETFRISKMNLVDLAGSENISKSGAQNQRAKEAGSINQSLLTLGRVINALADKNSHVPFRESKLTRLLQDSLGGNTKTALIATISPAKINADETSSTLEYATKAKSIKNRPQLGSFIMKDILVKNITTELAKIKSDLISTKTKDGVYMSHAHYKELTNDLENYKTEVLENKRAAEKLSTQNALLLKDKKTSNEINESQKAQIEKLNSNIGFLYDKIEVQHRNEQELASVVHKLMSAVQTMQRSLKSYEDQEQKFQSEMERVLYENVGSFKTSLSNEIHLLKENMSSEKIEIESNIGDIHSEFNRTIETIHSSSLEICQKFIEDIAKRHPAHFQGIHDQVRNINDIVSAYSSELVSKLSNISEEYNVFKEYLHGHFFKNTFQEALNIHVDKNYHQLKQSAVSMLNEFQEMMLERLDENRNTMLQGLKIAATEVMAKEMGLLDPVKENWEMALDNINKCDKLNSKFETEITTATNGLHRSIGTALDMSNSAVADMKENMTDLESGYEKLKKGEIIQKNIKEIGFKHGKLKNQLLSSANFMELAKNKFGEIDRSIQSLLDLQGNSTEDVEYSVSALLEHLNSKRLKPIGSSGKTPLRLQTNLPLIKDQKCNNHPMSSSASPMKEIDGNKVNGSPLKRKGYEGDSLSVKLQRIE